MKRARQWGIPLALLGLACVASGESEGPFPLGPLGSPPSFASHAARGTEITILLPAGTYLFPGDVLTFIGIAATETANGCTFISGDPTAYPEQRVVHVRQGSVNQVIRPASLSAIAISQTTPVPNGTRLGSFVFLGGCTVAPSAVSYDAYRGIVE